MKRKPPITSGLEAISGPRSSVWSAFEVDPASYEHFIETLRQGSAGLLRVGAAARLLQREAHKTSTFAKALKS